MQTIAEKIKHKRIAKGLSQQELADQSKLSLRTIQRIESGETRPREVTLSLLCSVLDISEAIVTCNERKLDIGKSVMDILLYSAINLILMITAGLFTLDSFATFYSRVAGLLLNFFVPYFIVSRTLHLKPLERLLKFGSGYVLYAVLLLIAQGFEKGFFAGFETGLFFCIMISVFTLYYGGRLFLSSKTLRH